MKVKFLIRCHIYYLLSKSSILIITISIVSLGALYFLNASASNYSLTIENVDGYYQSSITITKIIITFLSCFLFSNAFYVSSDSYVQLIVSNKLSKKKYAFSKIISIILIISLITFVLNLVFLLSGFLEIKGFVYEKRFVKSFICIYLEGIAYGLMSAFLTILLKNMFTFIGAASAFIICESFEKEEASNILKVAFLVFPVSNENLDIPYFGFVLLILYIILWVIMAVIIYDKKDYSL